MDAAPTDGLRITWAGHASTIVQLDGKTVLLDPVWSPKIGGVIRRLGAPGIPWENLPKVDAVLVSHNHYDHLDVPTLKRLPADTPIVVPAGNGRLLRRKGFAHVQELEWWQTAVVEGLKLHLVPAHHWSRRVPWDQDRSLWGGWVVEGKAQTAYFAGDTAYGPFFGDIARRHPRLDVAMMPIGAYAPRHYNGCNHVDPEESLQAFQDVGANVMVPVHWGTFRLSPEPIMEPIERLEAAWGRSGLERHRLWDLAVGESRQLGGKWTGLPRPAPIARETPTREDTKFPALDDAPSPPRLPGAAA
jgi:L-ascorbate metabolism protein UlaG (beta-lactamase superfamily)